MKIEEKDGKFIIADFNELDTYKIACKVEKDGLIFYKKLSQAIDDPQTKKLIEFLLEQENEHLKFFQGCLDEIRESKEDNFEEDDLLNSMDFGIFWPYQSIEDLERILKDVKKAIKLGMAIEDKSVKFYEVCKENVSSEDVKLELNNIIEEEKKHRELFRNLLNKG